MIANPPRNALEQILEGSFCFSDLFLGKAKGS